MAPHVHRDRAKLPACSGNNASLFPRETQSTTASKMSLSLGNVVFLVRGTQEGGQLAPRWTSGCSRVLRPSKPSPPMGKATSSQAGELVT